MSDDDDGSQEEVPIQLTWSGMQSGQEVPYMPLPHYSTNWLLPEGEREGEGGMMCEVFRVTPRIRLPWLYQDDQIRSFDRHVWECGTVWLHTHTSAPPFRSTAASQADLQAALQQLKGSIASAQYTLLVDRDGMSYDRRRFGGDHQIRVPSGRRFTLSVRRGLSSHSMILLVIDWGLLMF